ncbi:hypothetical protein D3C85_1210280 [compost metagenome]
MGTSKETDRSAWSHAACNSQRQCRRLPLSDVRCGDLERARGRRHCDREKSFGCNTGCIVGVTHILCAQRGRSNRKLAGDKTGLAIEKYAAPEEILPVVEIDGSGGCMSERSDDRGRQRQRRSESCRRCIGTQACECLLRLTRRANDLRRGHGDALGDAREIRVARIGRCEIEHPCTRDAGRRGTPGGDSIDHSHGCQRHAVVIEGDGSAGRQVGSNPVDGTHGYRGCEWTALRDGCRATG